MTGRAAYDEFGLFHENIAEFALDALARPEVRRVSAELGDGRHVSALRWGSGPASLALIHGGAQNAHTWDTVALALGVSLIAVDLPGHGHSSWRDDVAYTPANLADDVEAALAVLAPEVTAVVGMSLGGMTSIELAHRHPHRVAALMLVDITPGVDDAKSKAIVDFVNGPQTFASFDDLLARTIEHNPTRSASSLRRGILHNAHQLPSGAWTWNYDRSDRTSNGRRGLDSAALMALWDHFGAIDCPITLVRGADSPVVDDADVAEARRRQPTLVVHVVDGAGHSVQGDRPLELAALIETMTR